VGKNLGRHDDWARAAVWLDAALDLGPPSARIHRETLRQRVIAACVTNDARTLARMTERVDAPDSPFAESIGRKEWLLRLAARCAQR
jgi:hypothetical protein